MSSEMAKGQAAGGSQKNKVKGTGRWSIYKLHNQSLYDGAGGGNNSFCILQPSVLGSQ